MVIDMTGYNIEERDNCDEKIIRNTRFMGFL